jgi:tetratricopeptide (TPR) repeat protein
MARRLCTPAILCLAVAVGTGCSTIHATKPVPVMPSKDSSRVYDNHAAGQEIEEAKILIETSDPSEAIPRLLNTIQKYAGTDASLDARFWLGMAYYKIGSYRDAVGMFTDYVRQRPQGEHAAQCTELIARLTEESNAKYPTVDQLDAQIKKATEEVAAKPDDVQLQMDLADLLWNRGDYPKAGAVYAALVAKHADYAGNATITGRLEFGANGKYVLLTPIEMRRRQAEADPLVVINSSGFKSGRDLFTREQRFYSVSGQILNRSDSALNGVQVIVTIYGFGAAVLDTTTVNIGQLRRGEMRPFSVRFSNFDNIENVNRFECIGTFQR